ncbi:rRNA maturation RNase YbeY [Wenzhouxiangella sp. AB-CW3]|uniref:rRNA maturation RNase YbeY n=1 Tax=Wenzhouxiangella sp. AB-CW3 TaxID=2771012 RepID=UPI00168B96DC|nr:rRNA maturation RNase YbeY [Wenzhouxiangella sp. AB-CW3]QOC23874.1 rRNA maturation RNase YbeY [Wenzhouxiangella sp. AB-CW3]
MRASPESTPERLVIQRVHDGPEVPADELFSRWVDVALADLDDVGLVLRVVGEDEGRELNRQWRDRDHATNVLSFPADLPPGTPWRFLGDIVLCAPVIAREAEAQGKPLLWHWAHLVIHGILHLLGFDHMTPDQAGEMESREVELLRTLDISDPYISIDD